MKKLHSIIHAGPRRKAIVTGAFETCMDAVTVECSDASVLELHEETAVGEKSWAAERYIGVTLNM